MAWMKSYFSEINRQATFYPGHDLSNKACIYSRAVAIYRYSVGMVSTVNYKTQIYIHCSSASTMKSSNSIRKWYSVCGEVHGFT